MAATSGSTGTRPNIVLTEDEKRHLIEEGVRLARLHPHMSEKKLFDTAMESLPPGRRWSATSLRSLPRSRYEFFRDGLAAGLGARADQEQPDRPQAEEEEDIYPIVNGTVYPKGHDDGPAPAATSGGRPRKKHWLPEVWDQVIEAAIPIYRSMPAASRSHLLREATRRSLAEEFWPKEWNFSQGTRDRFWELLSRRLGQAETSPAPESPPAPEPTPILPGLRAVYDAMAPEPEPEPAPQVAFAPREPGTDLRSLLNRLVDKHFDEIEQNGRRYELIQRDVEGLRRSVVGLQGEMARIHSLLVRVCEALDPTLLEPAAPAPAPEPGPQWTITTINRGEEPTVRTFSAPRVEEKKPEAPPRIKVCVVGVLPDQGNRVVEQAGEFAEIRHYEDQRQAIANGFDNYDLVVITRHAGHMVQEKANKQLGHDRVRRLPTTSTDSIAEEIRTAYAKASRAFLLRQGGNTNGVALKGGLG